MRPWRRFAEIWRELDEARHPPAPLGRAPILVLIGGTVLLMVAMWFGHRGVFLQHFASSFDPGGRFFRLLPELWWAGLNVLCYLVVPAIALKFAGRRLGDFGFTFRGFRGHALTYLLLYLAVVPLILVASNFDSFKNTYPFSPEAGKGIVPFAIFETAYFLQFLAIEFFFRGFLLFGLRRHLGALAIPVMIVPYAMIHLGKPFAEGLGSIVAGIVLGTLALRTGSIAGGVMVHYAVALTMDLVALGQKGQLF